MFPLDLFINDFFNQDFWPHGDTPAFTGKGPKIGASRYDVAAVVSQMYAEEHRRLINDDRINAALMMQRAQRLIEWEATLAVTRQRQLEDAMYNVLLSEL